MSIRLSSIQANNSDPKLAKTMFLPLAERMAKKYVTEGRMEAEAEVTLYLIILEEMEKWQDALELVQGPLGKQVRTCPRPPHRSVECVRGKGEVVLVGEGDIIPD